MKKSVVIGLLLVFLLALVGCGNTPSGGSSEASLSEVAVARQSAIDKWQSESQKPDTVTYIEQLYEQYPEDETLKNLYFYAIAKQQWTAYEEMSLAAYYDTAVEYAAKINPDYTGELAAEMHGFVRTLIADEELSEAYRQATEQENRYKALTSAEKEEICLYIEGRYAAYDQQEGSYTGDTYSDVIMREAATRYELSVSQIELIWAKAHSY